MKTHGGAWDLFVLGGQSNMQGWMGDAERYPADPEGLDAGIPFWWTAPGMSTSGGWTTLKAQGGRFPKGHFGPEITFARALVKAGYRPAIFKYTLGATSIAVNWKGRGEGGMYDGMASEFAQAKRALEKNSGAVRAAAFLWIQGESDAENDVMANAYQQRLTTLIHDVRANVTREPELPVILGVDEQHDWVRQRPDIVECHRRCAAAAPRTTVFTSLYGLEKADSTHLTPSGLVAHGRRLFDAYESLAGRKVEALSAR